VDAPAEINTLAGEILTRDESLLFSATVTPPAGAGAPSEIERAADCPRLRLTGVNVITPGVNTVMFTAAGEMFAPPTALITVVPPLTAVAVKCTKVLLAGIVIVGGTLTILGLSDVNVSI
jgi:hypothetical protein